MITIKNFWPPWDADRVITPDDLCSPEYRAQLNFMAEKKVWAGGGALYAEEVIRICLKTKARTLLDYGCGFVDIHQAISMARAASADPRDPFKVPLRIQSYDPGIPGREKLPEPADVVMCVDCLEHVEPDKVQAVLHHIHSLTVKCALIMIATRPADKRLPDGRNAHLTIDNSSWWEHQLRGLGGWKGKVIEDSDRGLHMWWRKLDTTDEKTIG